MILKDMEPYVRDFLQQEWSDFWNVSYNENDDMIVCVWNGVDSTEIDFTYDTEEEELLFLSKEPQLAEDLIDMLKFLNNKVKELDNNLENDLDKEHETDLEER